MFSKKEKDNFTPLFIFIYCKRFSNFQSFQSFTFTVRIISPKIMLQSFLFYILVLKTLVWKLSNRDSLSDALDLHQSPLFKTDVVTV